MRKRFLIFVAPALYICAFAAAEERITVAAFEYPPIYQNEKDKGLSCEIVIEAFKAVHVEVDLKFLPVTRMVLNVSNGEELCGIGGRILFQDPSIEQRVRVSQTIQYVVQTFLFDSQKYPDSKAFDKLTSLGKHQIGVLNGSGIMKLLEKTPNLRLVPNTLHENSARQLYSGRIDLWAIVDLTGLKYLKELYPAKFRYFQFSKPYNLGDVSVVFSKIRDPNGFYQAKFEHGLSIIKKNGTFMRIMAKYYGGEKYINHDALPFDMK